MSEHNSMNRVALTIGGRRYVVTTDTDEAEVQKLADMVNDKITDLGTPGGHGGPNELMLAALSLAGDVLEERGRYEGLKDKIRQQSERLLSRMDMDRFREIA